MAYNSDATLERSFMHTSPILVAIVLMMTFSMPLDAAVLERDLVESGDALLTYDDVNQREWLDLPYSFDDLSIIQSRMQPGGILDGFNFATLEDVEQLMLSAEVSQLEGFTPAGTRGPGPRILVDYLGYIVRATGGALGEFQYTVGQVASNFNNEEPVFEDNNVVVYSIGTDFDPPVNNPLYLGSIGGYFSSPPVELFTGEIAGAGDIGPFWLYRSVIPEPSTLSLVFIAIFATLFHRRRGVRSITSKYGVLAGLPLVASDTDTCPNDAK